MKAALKFSQIATRNTEDDDE